MPTRSGLCAEPVSPICNYLAERWFCSDRADDPGRRELEMATVLVLRWLAASDHVTEGKVSRAAAVLEHTTK